jgi:hypothetical protein
MVNVNKGKKALCCVLLLAMSTSANAHVPSSSLHPKDPFSSSSSASGVEIPSPLSLELLEANVFDSSLLEDAQIKNLLIENKKMKLLILEEQKKNQLYNRWVKIAFWGTSFAFLGVGFYFLYKLNKSVTHATQTLDMNNVNALLSKTNSLIKKGKSIGAGIKSIGAGIKRGVQAVKSIPKTRYALMDSSLLGINPNPDLKEACEDAQALKDGYRAAQDAYKCQQEEDRLDTAAYPNLPEWVLGSPWSPAEYTPGPLMKPVLPPLDLDSTPYFPEGEGREKIKEGDEVTSLDLDSTAYSQEEKGKEKIKEEEDEPSASLSNVEYEPSSLWSWFRGEGGTWKGEINLDASLVPTEDEKSQAFEDAYSEAPRKEVSFPLIEEEKLPPLPLHPPVKNTWWNFFPL